MRQNEQEAIKRIMDGLKCSREEAEAIRQADKAIDRDEKMDFDLSPDKLKDAQKFAHAGVRKAPTAYKFDKRPRKENATKAGIIAEIAQFLTENSQFSVENLQITNKERQIAFEIGGEKFEFTLVQKRKPKK